MIFFELESITVLLKSAIYEWRLQEKTNEYSTSLVEAQAQSAEYSTILDLIGKIAVYTNKRETIGKIKEIFMMVMGAQKFKYWDAEYEYNETAPEITELFADKNVSKLLFKSENRFCIKIMQNAKLYGAVDISDFLFPQHLEKYLNFAIEISKVCGLVLSNIEQYEKIMKSEQELQYLSYHDALTGLNNRMYIDQVFNKEKTNNMTVFMLDIDRLKYVNDNFGHLEGDKLIISAASILKKCFRETGVVARIGGDEFLAIIPEQDVQVAEMFKQRTEETISLNN